MSVNDYNEDLYLAIRELVDQDLLKENTAEYGIALQVIHMGEDSLSPKQAWIYKNKVLSLFPKDRQDIDR